MPSEYVIQAIGLLGFFLGLAAYLTKNDIFLKVLIGAASLAMACHFFLLGAHVGAGAALFTGIRSIISIFQKMKIWAPLFFVAYVLLAWFAYQEWIDILPLCAGLIGTYAMFYLRQLPMRYWLFVTTFLWFLHNLFHGSIGGVLLETLYMAANLLTISRLRRNREVV
jgi:hypothetical protein